MADGQHAQFHMNSSSAGDKIAAFIFLYFNI